MQRFDADREIVYSAPQCKLHCVSSMYRTLGQPHRTDASYRILMLLVSKTLTYLVRLVKYLGARFSRQLGLNLVLLLKAHAHHVIRTLRSFL